MNVLSFLNVYAFLATAFCLAGISLKLARFSRMKWPVHVPAAVEIIDAAPQRSFRHAGWRFLVDPPGNFHRHSSLTWTCGYLFYHAAIFMVLGGYTASSLILMDKLIWGKPILDLAAGVPAPTSLTAANLLALVFGNAEDIPSAFLFGSFAPLFRAFAWCELPFAVIGNGCLLFTVLRKRCGAVRHDLDEAARDMRIPGTFSGQHLLVRLLILSLIAMEFIGRFEWVPGSAYYHAALGLTVIAAFPLTYLAHIPLAPLAVWLAIQRRRRNSIA